MLYGLLTDDWLLKYQFPTLLDLSCSESLSNIKEIINSPKMHYYLQQNNNLRVWNWKFLSINLIRPKTIEFRRYRNLLAFTPRSTQKYNPYQLSLYLCVYLNGFPRYVTVYCTSWQRSHDVAGTSCKVPSTRGKEILYVDQRLQW